MNSAKNNSNDDIYGSELSRSGLPKSKFPAAEGNPRVAYSEIHDELMLVRHGVSRDLASLLLDDMKASLDYFKKHPLQAPLTSDEASGFHH
jgi:hypothetical protein